MTTQIANEKSISDISQDLIGFLQSPVSVRQGCERLFNLLARDELKHFSFHPDYLERTADYVIEVTKHNYPSLDIPYHSRWRHFSAGGVNRWPQFTLQYPTLTAVDIAKSAVELAIISVYLDAGAGMSWRYQDEYSNTTYSKSEGLAVASFNMFIHGAFSSDVRVPYLANSLALKRFTREKLNKGFQISETNPLIGWEGRLKLLHQLGQCIESRPDLFGETSPRLGNLVDIWLSQSVEGQLSLETVFSVLLDAFSKIWPGRYQINNRPLGDVWCHQQIITEDNPKGLIPFHKLTQWLTYSLVEPLENLGLQIIGTESLTGLPEYRNGGLFVDLGVITPKDKQCVNQVFSVGDEFIVEWRALTVALLDRLANLIREKLNRTADELPLVKILQGGTWSAGRKIALELRPDGGSPFQLKSDGTVF